MSTLGFMFLLLYLWYISGITDVLYHILQSSGWPWAGFLLPRNFLGPAGPPSVLARTFLGPLSPPSVLSRVSRVSIALVLRKTPQAQGGPAN